jgi:hypothetical protein
MKEMCSVTNLSDGIPVVSWGVGPSVASSASSSVSVWSVPTPVACATLDALPAAVVSQLQAAPDVSSGFSASLCSLLGSDAVDADAVARWAGPSTSAAWYAAGAASSLAPARRAIGAEGTKELDSQLLLLALSPQSMAQVRANLPAALGLWDEGLSGTTTVRLFVRLVYAGVQQDVHFDFLVQLA